MTTDTEDVNPDETPESSTGVDQDAETQATDSSTEASAADTGSQSAESDSSKVNDKKTRQQLIDELTGRKKDPEAEEETDEVEPEKAEGEEQAENAGKPAEKAEDDKPLSNEELEAPIGKEGTVGARKRIQFLLKERKVRDEEIAKLKPVADFGTQMLTIAKEGNLAPEQLGAWLALAKEVNQKGPAEAVQRFIAEAERLAQAANVTLPRRVETVVPAELDAIEEMLIADLADGNIPGDVMKRYLEKIKAAKKAGGPAKTVTPPAPEKPPVQPVNAQPAQTPSATQHDPVTVNAVNEIAKVQAEFAQKHPADWPKIKDLVQQRIGRYAGTHPTKWAGFYREEVEKALKENSTPVKKVSTTQPLRPTTTTTTTKPASGKSAAVGILTGKIK